MSSRYLSMDTDWRAEVKRRLDWLEAVVRGEPTHDHIHEHPELPAGWLAYAVVSSGQTGISSTTDLTGLAVTLTIPAGRKIRIVGHVGYRQRTAAGSVVAFIQEGSTVLGRFGTQTQVTDGFGLAAGAIIIEPSAASHTYKLTMSTTGGTVDTAASSTQPAYILVEDIGAV